MGLVTAKEVAKAINVDKFGFAGTFMGWTLMKVLKISKANEIYDRNKHLSDLEFLNAILDEFEIDFLAVLFCEELQISNTGDYRGRGEQVS